MATDEQQQYEDFDAFWESHAGATRTMVRIRGQLVPEPVDIPLSLAMRAEQADITDEDEVRDLIAQLYGDEVLDTWIEAGMGTAELAVVLAWSAARGSGDKISFERAAELVEEAKAGKLPAPANRAERRAATRRTASGGTGQRSSPTSGASTGSRRRRPRH